MSAEREIDQLRGVNHVLRAEVAARDATIEELRGALEEKSLAIIEARNPGIDIEQVRRERAAALLDVPDRSDDADVPPCPWCSATACAPGRGTRCCPDCSDHTHPLPELVATEPCPECGGRGMVVGWGKDVDGNRVSAWRPCPLCGTGQGET